MKSLAEFRSKVKFVLTDIDDTMTDEGQLGPDAYQALWSLHKNGIQVIPVTGRPAGWCEMIARMWPVAGVVGENGGFYFRYVHKKMKRNFFFDEKTQFENRKKLNLIENEVLSSIPGTAIASDQFCRLMDLAIDFCEDVPPLAKTEVSRIVEIFKKHGAQAKVSSIHVNGWFGKYDKLTKSLEFLQQEFNVSQESVKDVCAFIGDSPNDEPMFQYFPHSFAVANIQHFVDQIQHHPTYVAQKKGGAGFAEIAQKIINSL